ncbi:MAG TPA: alpha/beta fold hydrolase [Patescibacteria group bacterium]
MGEKCETVDIITPKKFRLNGLWFGPENPKKALIFIHGLNGSAFSSLKILVPLVNKETSLLTFSNRGTAKISKIKKIDKRKRKGSTSFLMGEAHEIFTDCVDDIEGAINLTKGKGAKEIYLIGHSTGCQKSIYYLSQRGKQKSVAGVALLCPLSDYAFFIKSVEPEKIKHLYEIAREMLKDNPHKMMPFDIWPDLHDAQRFLSLYSPDSPEEIFCYAQTDKSAEILQKVKIPILIIFADKDEYRDRPTSKLQEWFKSNTRSKQLTISAIKNATHGFETREKEARKEITKFINRNNTKV